MWVFILINLLVFNIKILFVRCIEVSLWVIKIVVFFLINLVKLLYILYLLWGFKVVVGLFKIIIWVFFFWIKVWAIVIFCYFFLDNLVLLNFLFKSVLYFLGSFFILVKIFDFLLVYFNFFKLFIVEVFFKVIFLLMLRL